MSFQTFVNRFQENLWSLCLLWKYTLHQLPVYNYELKQLNSTITLIKSIQQLPVTAYTNTLANATEDELTYEANCTQNIVTIC